MRTVQVKLSKAIFAGGAIVLMFGGIEADVVAPDVHPIVSTVDGSQTLHEGDVVATLATTPEGVCYAGVPIGVGVQVAPGHFAANVKLKVDSACRVVVKSITTHPLDQPVSTSPYSEGEYAEPTQDPN